MVVSLNLRSRSFNLRCIRVVNISDRIITFVFVCPNIKTKHKKGFWIKEIMVYDTSKRKPFLHSRTHTHIRWLSPDLKGSVISFYIFFLGISRCTCSEIRGVYKFYFKGSTPLYVTTEGLSTILGILVHYTHNNKVKRQQTLVTRRSSNRVTDHGL